MMIHRFQKTNKPTKIILLRGNLRPLRLKRCPTIWKKNSKRHKKSEARRESSMMKTRRRTKGMMPKNNYHNSNCFVSSSKRSRSALFVRKNLLTKRQRLNLAATFSAWSALLSGLKLRIPARTASKNFIRLLKNKSC